MSLLPKKQPPIAFLLDENVDIRLSSLLKNKGYSVLRVPAGIKNGAVIKLAQKENCILLTNDKDFANPLLFPKLKYQGIIVFHIHPPDIQKLTMSLERLLSKLKPEDTYGKIFLVEENGFTVLDGIRD